MQKEIGSNFWLSPKKYVYSNLPDGFFNVNHEDSVFTSSGRSAISLTLSDLNIKCKTALLPSFTCESVIIPFLKHGYNLSFYRVDQSANIIRESFQEDVKSANPSVILIHNYYGFDTSSAIREDIIALKEKGIIIIEDITQSLFSSFPRLVANYYVGSFRKWGEIPDGGFALKTCGSFAKKPEISDFTLAKAKVDAMKDKYEYIVNGVGHKEAFLQKYSIAEAILETQTDVFKMSPVSICEIANINEEVLKSKRRENYLYLQGHLSGSLFTHLPGDSVPLYFPVQCHSKRAAIQKKLRDNRIYAPIVWPRSEYVNHITKPVKELYDGLLCLPCDQRYDLDDMERVTSIFCNMSKLNMCSY